MNLSKSRYCVGIRCQKELWLSCYKEEVAKEQDNDVIIENGNKVGEFARGLFGNYILIENNDNKEKMIQETKKYLAKKPNIICEASFSYLNNFCSVDILKNDEDGVEIYEVKSSTQKNDIYIDDLSYQTWVLKKCGLNVKKSYLVYVNNKYIKKGKVDSNSFFKIEEITLRPMEEIEENIKKLEMTINNSQEPDIDLSVNCKKNKKVPYDCPYFQYCTRNLPTPNIFDVGWKTTFTKKLGFYYQNKLSYSDILSEGGINPKADLQMSSELNNLGPKIDIDSIKSFLSTLTYPLYFLDFESYQVAIPEIDGTHPYQQICFQYSLHYYLEENKELYHKEFLSDDYNGNPMRGLCKQLCEDIPMNSCVIVYNQSFEITRLKEMAALFPEYRTHLLNIASNIKDLYPIFRDQEYYVKEMGGSSSIKEVLPALFPNDPSLDYHNLNQVHKGDEASEAFLSLRTKSREEQEELRHNMLKYCELDTYATVKILQKLKTIK